MEFGHRSPDQVQVTGKAFLRHLQIGHQLWGPFISSDRLTAIATAEQAAVADALIATGTLWGFGIGNVSTGGHGVPLQQLDAVHRNTDNYYQPFTIGSCANDTIEGPNDNRPLAFPIPPGNLPQNLPEQQINNSLLLFPSFPFHEMTHADLLNTAGPSSENRLRWIELPQDPFNGTAIGAVILLPTQDQRDGNSLEQEILVCDLGAGWGSSTLNTSTQNFGSRNVRSSLSDAKSVAKKINSVDIKQSNPGLSEAEDAAIQTSMVFVLPFNPERPINISQS